MFVSARSIVLLILTLTLIINNDKTVLGEVSHHHYHVQINLFKKANLQERILTMTIERCETIPLRFQNQILSANTDECVILYIDDCCQGFGIQTVDTVNLLNTHLAQTGVASVSPCDDYRSDFPRSLQDNVGDGATETMIKVEEFHDTAMYYNERTINCTKTRLAYAEFIDNVWSYTKYIYGHNFGPEGSTLLAFFHGGDEKKVGPYSRSHYFKEGNCRNIIHLRNPRVSAWAGGVKSERMDDVLRAISTLVVWAGKGVYNNPAASSDVWGNNVWPWSEIFIYDVYRGLGMIEDATRVYEHYIETPHQNPSPGTFWFEKWFFPLYMEYGGVRILNNYVNLLSRHFPRKHVMEWAYDRTMNLGEFVHFFSGAVGVDLRNLAMETFQWDRTKDAQLRQAKHDFPRINYLKGI